MSLTKINKEGKKIPQTYYSSDYKFEIEKGTVGWNVSELNESRSKRYGYDVYEYSYSCDTLKEVYDSIFK